MVPLAGSVWSPQPSQNYISQIPFLVYFQVEVATRINLHTMWEAQVRQRTSLMAAVLKCSERLTQRCRGGVPVCRSVLLHIRFFSPTDSPLINRVVKPPNAKEATSFQISSQVSLTVLFQNVWKRMLVSPYRHKGLGTINKRGVC